MQLDGSFHIEVSFFYMTDMQFVGTAIINHSAVRCQFSTKNNNGNDVTFTTLFGVAGSTKMILKLKYNDQ